MSGFLQGFYIIILEDRNCAKVTESIKKKKQSNFYRVSNVHCGILQ